MTDECSLLCEFAEFLNVNNDSGGFRLAEFLQKKNGGVVDKPRLVFGDIEPENCSLSVHMQPPQNVATNGERSAKPFLPQPKPLPTDSAVEEDQAVELVQNIPNTSKESNPNEAVAVPEPAIKIVVQTVPNSPSIKIRSPSQRSIRKSASTDLRHYCANRLSALGGGRRTLLKEFESTMSTTTNFSPPIASTPISERILPTQNALQNEIQSSVEQNNENLNIHTQKSQKYCMYLSSSQSGHSYVVEKGAIPGQILLTPAKVADNTAITPTKSPTKKSNAEPTNDKSQINPAQLAQNSIRNDTQKCAIIVKDKILKPGIPNSTTVANPTNQSNISQLAKTLQEKSQNIIIPIIQTFNSDSKLTKKNKDVDEVTETLKKNNVETEVLSRKSVGTSPLSSRILNELGMSPPTTRAKNVAISKAQSRTSEGRLGSSDILTEDDTEVDLTSHSQIASKLHQNADSVPLNLAPSKRKSKRTIRLGKRKSKQAGEKPQRNSQPMTEADAEAGPPRAHPLNLRRTRQEQPRSNACRYLLTLSKPPSSPINGEKFAGEIKAQLARLTNYEILDLRKRNSMGIVFPVSGRKSIEKQLDLEKHIDLEILKRNLESNDEIVDFQQLENDVAREEPLIESINNAHCTDNDIYSELIAAPPQFRDQQLNEPNETGKGVAEKRQTINKAVDTILSELIYDHRESSLVGERSCDRVSFVPPPAANSSSAKVSKKSKKKSKKRQPTPELCKKYLEMSKKIKDHKRDSKFKRILYSTDLSTSDDDKQEEPTTTPPRNVEKLPQTSVTVQASPQPQQTPPQTPTARASRSLRRSDPDLQCSSKHNTTIVTSVEPRLRRSNPDLQCSSNHNTTIVTSVEPTQTTDRNASTTPRSSLKAVTVSVKDVNSSKSKKRGSQHDASLREKETAITPTTVDDADLFKRPAPKAKKDRPKRRTKAPTTETVTQTPSETGTTLRRSKRGHVPLKNNWSFRTNDPTPLFQILYQQQLMKRLNAADKRQNRRILQSYAELTLSDSDRQNLSKLANETNKVTKKMTGSEPKKASAQKAITARSILGDTNASSSSCSSSIGRSISRQPLPPIYEPQHTESEAEEELTTAPLSPRKRKSPEHKAANAKKQVPKWKTSTATNNTSEANETNASFNHSRIQVSNAPLVQLKNLFNSWHNISALNEQPPAANEEKTTTQSSNTSSTTNKKVSKSNSHPTDTPRTFSKNLRVRVLRCDTNAPAPTQKLNDKSGDDEEEQHTVNKSATTAANSELLNWLKGIYNSESTSATGQIFSEMHCSAAGNLQFTNLDGLDYAFYDTNMKSSIGYMRFKPKQHKPTARAKLYHLHIVVLEGEFEMSTDSDKGRFRTGDMIAINKGSRYSLRNLTDAIGLVMFIKK